MLSRVESGQIAAAAQRCPYEDYQQLRSVSGDIDTVPAGDKNRTEVESIDECMLSYKLCESGRNIGDLQISQYF
jgi:hypothetical protein